jgi:structural maintenance of chromosome 1
MINDKQDMQQVTRLKQDRDDYLRKLTDLGHQLRSFAREQQLASEISSLETRHKSAKYELELAMTKLDKNKAESAQLDKQIKKIATDTKKAEKSLQTLSDKLETLRTKISAVEDEVFEDFNDEVGIENIREYENARVNRAKQESEMKIRFSTQRSRIENLLDYEEKRDLAGTLQAVQDRVKQLKEELKALKVSFA